MNANRSRLAPRDEAPSRGVRWPHKAPSRGARWLLWTLSAVLLVCGSSTGLCGEAPTAADFPELATAYGPIDRFVSASTVLVGKEGQPGPADPQQRCRPFPANAPVLAFGENDHFLCAVGDASQAVGASAELDSEKAGPTFVRRILFLKPSIFVLDDVVRGIASAGPLRWRADCRSEPTLTGSQWCITEGDRRLVCKTLWPAGAVLRKTPKPEGTSDSACHTEVEPSADANPARWLHVLQMLPAGDGAEPAKPVLEERHGHFALTVTTPDRVFRLTLPPPGAGAGRVAVQDAEGETIVPRRPLPAGVLPHGPKGIAMIERWDRAYRGGRKPGWDSGIVAPDLKRAVEEGAVRPCRTVVLGCGSGTNAVYLAQKGFDVTAIDIAPTALSIAEAKAEKAGVRVRWLLADVLAPPDLEPFDFIFDRGCYHNVRYVDAAGFVESMRRLSRPGTRALILSLNRDGPPGVREEHMRGDFSELFDFEWLRESGIQTGRDGNTLRASWSLMLRRKKGDVALFRGFRQDTSGVCRAGGASSRVRGARRFA